MAIVLLLAAGGELGQAAGVVQGVFDFWDLALILLAFLVAQVVAHGETHTTERTLT